MIGVILAAGIGSRLRPLTSNKPKCLVKTANKPIIEYQIDAYIKAGIEELIIVSGYESEAIEKYCKHIKRPRIKIIKNNDYESTNNMYSLYLAKKHILGKPFILNNGDLAIDEDIILKLKKSKYKDAIAVDREVYSEESMKISVDKENHVTGISKDIARSAAYGVSIDFYKFSAPTGKVLLKEIQHIIEAEDNKKDWTEVAMQRIFSKKRIKCYPFNIGGSRWVEIDNYEDLAVSDRLFSNFDQAINEIDLILLDLDGTTYVGSDPVPGASEVIAQLQSKGKEIYFLSNNSSKTKKDYVDLLATQGISTSHERIVLSTDSLINFLKAEESENLFILGTKKLRENIKDSGFNVDSDQPEYIVVGYDSELTYEKLKTACYYINRGADILATHCDKFCPSELGPIPDAGAILALLEETTGKRAKFIFGKPDSKIVENFFKNETFTPARTLVIGDRLHTDIMLAKNISCKSLLVLSGETNREDLETSEVTPDFILNSISHI
jgi:HAD superfamily hydrolase (TIGR01450 family)